MEQKLVMEKKETEKEKKKINHEQTNTNKNLIFHS